MSLPEGLTNIPEDAKQLEAMVPRPAVEMVNGKKYLMIFQFAQPLAEELFARLRESTPAYEEYFRAHGIDVTVMIVSPPMSVQLYELEGKAQAQGTEGK
jgi:hypothetical protein